MAFCEQCLLAKTVNSGLYRGHVLVGVDVMFMLHAFNFRLSACASVPLGLTLAFIHANEFLCHNAPVHWPA